MYDCKRSTEGQRTTKIQRPKVFFPFPDFPYICVSFSKEREKEEEYAKGHMKRILCMLDGINSVFDE